MERSKKIKKVKLVKKQKEKPIKEIEKEENELEVKINPYTNMEYSENYYKILKQRMKLPAYKAKKEFLNLF